MKCQPLIYTTKIGQQKEISGRKKFEMATCMIIENSLPKNL